MSIKHSLPIPPHKILIIRLSAIGDVVRTLPALRALRSTFPSSYIAWVVEENAQDLLQGHPDLNRLLVFKRKKLRRGFLSIGEFFSSCGELLDFLRELRREHFDLVLDFHGILKSGVISFLSGSPLRVGWSRGCTKEGNFLFNNYHVVLSTSAMSRFERNLMFIRFLGINGVEQEPIIPITDGDKGYIEHFFKEQGLPNHTPLIAIHPGTSLKTSYKRWETSSYTTVADMLIEKIHASIVWTWGGGELAMVEDIVKGMRHRSTIACKTENLRQLAELFRRCDLFVGCDSGPMHIASLVKTPVVVLFGPTDPVVNAPYQNNPHLVLRKDLPCSPCRKRNCESVECMRMITPDEVCNAAITLLKERVAYRTS
jgi:lipopolysaccharide heptosyltransferase II